jgi:hypothetical protein
MLQSIYGPTDTKLIAGQMAALYTFAISNLSTTLSRQRAGNSFGCYGCHRTKSAAAREVCSAKWVIDDYTFDLASMAHVLGE